MILYILEINNKFKHTYSEIETDIVVQIYNKLIYKYNIVNCQIKHKKYYQTMTQLINNCNDTNQILISKISLDYNSEKEIHRIISNIKKNVNKPILFSFIKSNFYEINYPNINIELVNNVNIDKYLNNLTENNVIIPNNWYRLRLLAIPLGLIIYKSFSVISKHQSITL